jgi:hypothetical protein
VRGLRLGPVMSKRRIIFLDVDGVLNHYDTKHRVHPETADDMPQHLQVRGSGLIGMDPSCVKNLATLVEKTDAEVVLSSTWRKPPYGLGKTERCARRQGYTGPRWIGVTPTGVRTKSGDDEGMYSLPKFSERYNPRGSTPRGLEIQEWLDDNTKGEEVEFIIIDDDSDMVHLSNRLVHTDMSDGGFTDAKLAEALKFFGVDA